LTLSQEQFWKIKQQGCWGIYNSRGVTKDVMAVFCLNIQDVPLLGGELDDPA
jgi:hypothetical protein